MVRHPGPSRVLYSPAGPGTMPWGQADAQGPISWSSPSLGTPIHQLRVMTSRIAADESQMDIGAELGRVESSSCTVIFICPLFVYFSLSFSIVRIFHHCTYL